MVHRTRRAKKEMLGRRFIIVERGEWSAKKFKKPELEVVEAPQDFHKAKALAKKLSGQVTDVAWVADATSVLYKGGERRI